mgnify:CR=1 FL=1
MGRNAVVIENEKSSDDELPKFKHRTLGEIVGGQSGEADQDTVPGGWQGTDDATSTAPSDIPPVRLSADETFSSEEEADRVLGRAAGGGMLDTTEAVTDIKGTPVEESKDWEHDPIENQV